MNTDTLPLETLKKLEAETESALRKIRDRRQNLEDIDRDARLDAIKPLVVRAHGLLCCWNHCDGCSWGYEMTGEVHDWTGWAHARWLRHYEELLIGTNPKAAWKTTPQQLSQILDAVEQLRKIDPNALYFIRQGICAP